MDKELLVLSDKIRECIYSKQKELNLSFVEDTHTYTMNDIEGNPKTDFPSVSKVLKNFYIEFPSEEISFRKAKGNIEEQQKLLSEWKFAADYSINIGSRTHYFLEKKLISRYNNFKEVRQPIFECDEYQTLTSETMIKGGDKYIDLMHDRGAVLIDTEIILGDNKLGYVGQPDKIWLINNKNNDGYGFIITDWKGLPLDTPILTEYCWKTMGDLTKNDKVFDKDGELVNIKNISEVKNKKCLKIIFDNKEEIISDFEHRWLVYTESCGIKKEMIMTTQEIKNYNDNLIKRYSYKILKIENPKPIKRPNISLPIDPYLLGVWLGDHKITEANIEVCNEIKRRGYEIGNDVSDLNLLKNKHIPIIYLLSSYEQRLDLLRGLMDSDGYYNKTRKRFSITTTREFMVDYYLQLISSLGLKPTVIKYIKKFNGEKIKCFNVEFNTSDFNPFLARNQDITVVKIKNKSSFRSILSVIDVESIPTKCIEVDSISNTFLCGKTLIVTHNTNKPKNFETQWYTKQMLKPFEKYPDTQLSHYYIQLPLYARLFLSMLKDSEFNNLKFLGGVVVLLKECGNIVEYKVPNDFFTKVNEYRF